MQAHVLLNYIKNPQLLDKESVPELQKLVNDFPYFQAAHILLSMAAKKWDASVYQQTLKKTAIIANNRAHLFHLINGLDEVLEIEEPKEVKQTVFDENNVVNEDESTLEEIKALKNTIEDIKHELDILKATEIAVETSEIAKTKEDNTNKLISVENTNAVKDKINVSEQIDIEELGLLSEEVAIEKEIEKSLVNAFVEKEIINTPALHQQNEDNTRAESFSDWLNLLKKNNGQSSEEIKEQVALEKRKQKNALKTNKQLEQEKNEAEIRKQKQKSIIDKIIEINPGVIRNKDDKKFYTPVNHAKESLIENEHLVTETLAKIYAMQGNVNKAVRAYEILSLKFPQKSVYFASLIKKLKENQ